MTDYKSYGWYDSENDSEDQFSYGSYESDDQQYDKQLPVRVLSSKTSSPRKDDKEVQKNDQQKTEDQLKYEDLIAGFIYYNDYLENMDFSNNPNYDEWVKYEMTTWQDIQAFHYIKAVMTNHHIEVELNAQIVKNGPGDYQETLQYLNVIWHQQSSYYEEHECETCGNSPCLKYKICRVFQKFEDGKYDDNQKSEESYQSHESEKSEESVESDESEEDCDKFLKSVITSYNKNKVAKAKAKISINYDKELSIVSFHTDSGISSFSQPLNDSRSYWSEYIKESHKCQFNNCDFKHEHQDCVTNHMKFCKFNPKNIKIEESKQEVKLTKAQETLNLIKEILNSNQDIQKKLIEKFGQNKTTTAINKIIKELNIQITSQRITQRINGKQSKINKYTLVNV